VEGYRVELPDEHLTANFGPDSALHLTPDLVGLRVPMMPSGHTERESSTCSDLMPSTVLRRWRPGRSSQQVDLAHVMSE